MVVKLTKKEKRAVKDVRKGKRDKFTKLVLFDSCHMVIAYEFKDGQAVSYAKLYDSKNEEIGFAEGDDTFEGVYFIPDDYIVEIA